MDRERDIITRINEKFPHMSKGHKAIAAFILEHYDQAAFMTAARLGRQLHVSESTVVRFASGIGYSGYPEMQAELAAHLLHVDVHGARFAGVVVLPDVREQLFACDRDVDVAHEEDEHVELLRRQHDGLAVFRDRMALDVDADVAVLQAHFTFARAPEHDLDAREQLDGLERLYDVVLRAAAQALDLVGHRAERRQKDDRP